MHCFLPSFTEGTFLERGLVGIFDQIFTPSKGDRPRVSNALFVLSDGDCTKCEWHLTSAVRKSDDFKILVNTAVVYKAVCDR